MTLILSYTLKHVYGIILRFSTYIVSEWFASIMMDNNECTALLCPESDQEIKIKISRRAFTWDVVFYTKNVQNNTPIRTLPVNNEGWLKMILFFLFTISLN